MQKRAQLRELRRKSIWELRWSLIGDDCATGASKQALLCSSMQDSENERTDFYRSDLSATHSKPDSFVVIFHEIVVEKSRDIYEGLLEDDKDVDEATDEAVDEASDEEVDEASDEEVDEASDEEVDEAKDDEVEENFGRCGETDRRGDKV